MNMFNNLPLYMMDIDGTIKDPGGVDYVALVDRPAIQKGFLAFNDHTPKSMAFAITSEDRHIVSGPLMLANTPIYRCDEKDGEYYVMFSAPVIEKTVKKFFSQGNHTNVNEMHDPSKKVDDVWMFESFITDKSRGILPIRGYEDAPDGSWFVSFQVDNEGIWGKIKDGTFTGFSVEGIFDMLIPVDSPEEMMSQLTKDEQEQLAILSEAFKIFT